MKNIIRVFMSLERKDRFIYGLTAIIIANTAFGSYLDFGSGRTKQAIVQGLLALTAIGLLAYYRAFRNVTVFIYAGIFAASIGYDALLYFDHYALYTYLIPLIMPLVFFLLLPLKPALIVSFIHYAVALSLRYYAFAVLHIGSVFFEKDAIQAYTLGMLFILVLGIVYHLSIETAFRDLQHANAQKEILLKEIHHRIKNNLNKMASGLGLQILRLHRGHNDDPEEILRKNKLRIEAMALVHEALYRSEDLVNVNVDEYMHRLLILIDQAYDHTHIVTIHATKVTLSPGKILRLGTILNELYTNTLKHTDPDHPIHVEIHLIQTESHCTLTYHQTGHPNTIDPDTLTQSHGLGMMLVRLSVEEMGGGMTTESIPGELRFSLRFYC